MSFENDTYTVDEDDGRVEVCFLTSAGHPDRDILVTVQPVETNSAAPGHSCTQFNPASGGKVARIN